MGICWLAQWKLPPPASTSRARAAAAGHEHKQGSPQGEPRHGEQHQFPPHRVNYRANLWALRGAAPTRLAWAGAGAGLLAGALGALAYALHCPEMAAPFLAVWYLAGMALPTLAGAWLGPRVLRW